MKLYRTKTLSNQNPKSEARNPKQLQRQINLKSGKSKIPNPKEACLEFYMFWSFEIVSNFGFRASNFLFLAPSRLCASHRFPDCVIQNSTENFKYLWLAFHSLNLGEEARRRALGLLNLVKWSVEWHPPAGQRSQVGDPLHDHDSRAENHAVHRKILRGEIG